ncbi:MAG: hypothetical protein ACLTSG_06665 [Lachnospiraceae bacterium]
MSRSAEDLELSCDEAVLFGAPKDERRRYADLLLSTAGDARGFTTCLSATGRSLRYRLKNVMQPPMKAGGALAIGLAVFFHAVVLRAGGPRLRRRRGARRHFQRARALGVQAPGRVRRRRGGAYRISRLAGAARAHRELRLRHFRRAASGFPL